VRVPETPIHLDAILADEDLAGGLEPRLGASALRTLTVLGFPSQTWPGLLDDLNRLAFPYRCTPPVTAALLAERFGGSLRS
jgi:type IV secretion system protein VirB4